MQEVTYDAQGRLISIIDFRPWTSTTYYFDEAGHLIADGVAAESSCRTHTYEAKDILAIENDWERVEEAEDDVQLEDDGEAEASETEENGTGTSTGQ
jgi:YD repeat-containing protein